MAYNNDNKDEGNNYKKKTMSFPFGEKFFNHTESKDPACGPLQMEIWDNRLSFSFVKFDNTKKGSDSYTNGRFSVNGDVAMMMLSLVEQIVRQRNDIWVKSKGKPVYPNIEIPLQDVFMDKERQVHNLGYYFFKSVEVEEEGNKVNRIQFGHVGDKETFKVVLGSALMPVVVSKYPDAIERVDPRDTPLYRFMIYLKQFSGYGALFYSGLNRIADMISYQGRQQVGDNRGGQRSLPPSRGSSSGNGYRPNPNDQDIAF